MGIDFKKGDRVFMNNRYKVPMKYKGKIFIVSSEPQIISGSERVYLEGYKGSYACDGLFKVTGRPSAETSSLDKKQGDRI